jgi:hypothetical protein
MHPVAPSRMALLDVLLSYGTPIVSTVREDRAR